MLYKKYLTKKDGEFVGGLIVIATAYGGLWWMHGFKFAATTWCFITLGYMALKGALKCAYKI